MFAQSEKKCFWTVIGAGFAVVGPLAQPNDLPLSDAVDSDRRVADAEEASSVDRKSFRIPAPQSSLQYVVDNPVPDAVDSAKGMKIEAVTPSYLMDL